MELSCSFNGNAGISKTLCMNILLATGLFPPDVGGHSKYAKAIRDELVRMGHKAPVVAYGALEKKLPLGVRHVVYFLRLLPHIGKCDAVLAFDTWSVGLPALIATKLFGKKFMVRIGGDFLWEAYVERTGDLVKLSEFYTAPRPLNLKERIIRRATEWFIHHTDALVFTTTWQRDLWQSAYGFEAHQAFLVENHYAEKKGSLVPEGRVFVAAGREMKLKNIARLKEAFLRVQKRHGDITLETDSLPPREHKARVERCYAMVVPSISEVNPNNAIEALSLVKPFIAPKDSGIYDRLKDVGLFVDTSNTDELERGIESLLDEEVYATYVAKIQAFSYTHSWEEMTEEFISIAHTICASSR